MTHPLVPAAVVGTPRYVEPERAVRRRRKDDGVDLTMWVGRNIGSQAPISNRQAWAQAWRGHWLGGVQRGHVTCAAARTTLTLTLIPNRVRGGEEGGIGIRGQWLLQYVGNGYCNTWAMATAMALIMGGSNQSCRTCSPPSDGRGSDGHLSNSGSSHLKMD